MTSSTPERFRYFGLGCDKVDLDICDREDIQSKIIIALYRLWGVTPCGYQKYEVRFNDVAYGVDLTAKTCACRIWQLTGIPCLHGVAAISSLNQDAETYVKDAYVKCYNYSINPLNGSDMWPEVPYRKPLPPKRRRLLDRELSGLVRHFVTRRGSLIRCSICKEPSHNKKKCPSKQKTNTSGKCPNHLNIIPPSSSRGSGAGPSQPPLVAAAQPPQPPPPPPPAQPPLPPPTTRPVPRRGPIGRNGRRQYSVRIVKMELRTNIPRVGSSVENPAVLD
uniref:SWIM-type domain-containing protein n=1 Tax=Lactuca sativa TaxID=4236 RepID=A0A9R1WPB7_LACSA|nr:hypothetical protein LSAT_V11C900492840 [Lactuca sativa]